MHELDILLLRQLFFTHNNALAQRDWASLIIQNTFSNQ